MLDSLQEQNNSGVFIIKFLYVDCGFAGIAGDLFLSACGDLIGIERMQPILQKLLDAISPENPPKIHLISKESNGIRGIYCSLMPITNAPHLEILHEGNHTLFNHSHSRKDPPHLRIDSSSHGKGELHTSTFSLANFRKTLDIALEACHLSGSITELAHQNLMIILNAEAFVHQIPVEEVHLHEIGAIDTILDITGTLWALNELGCLKQQNSPTIFCSSIAVGGGIVNFSHGILPVPAPATADILQKYKIPFHFGPADFELATPTGVSIIATLYSNGYLTFAPPPVFVTLDHIGTGIGSYILPNRPNMLRIFSGETNTLSSIFSLTHPIYVLETNVDDVRGEILGNLIQVLLDHGAVDAHILPTITKKNRPGYLITVISPLDTVAALADCLIRETGTLGVRVNLSQRICLDRTIITHTIHLENREFQIHIKESRNSKGEIIQHKIEFDDLQLIAKELHHSIREVEDLIKTALNSLPL